MVFLSLYIVIGGLFGGLVQCMFALSDYDELSPSFAFWFATSFYEAYSDQLNRAGLIIGVVLISLAVLPGSILVILMFALSWFLQKLWQLFVFIFRKDRGNRYEQNG